jgi:hypothetical protein
MAHPIVSTNSAAANLVSLINANNVGLNLATTQVSIGNPAVHGGTPGKNTEVVVTMLPNQRYRDSATFKYTRLPIGAASVAPQTTFSYVNETTFADLKAATAAGLNVVAGEYTFDFTGILVNGQAVTFDNISNELTYFDGTANATTNNVAVAFGFANPTAPDFKVVAKADSLLYTGEVAVDLTWDRPTLASVVTVTDLDGFDPAA